MITDRGCKNTMVPFVYNFDDLILTNGEQCHHLVGRNVTEKVISWKIMQYDGYTQ